MKGRKRHSHPPSSGSSRSCRPWRRGGGPGAGRLSSLPSFTPGGVNHRYPPTGPPLESSVKLSLCFPNQLLDNTTSFQPAAQTAITLRLLVSFSLTSYSRSASRQDKRISKQYFTTSQDINKGGPHIVPPAYKTSASTSHSISLLVTSPRSGCATSTSRGAQFYATRPSLETPREAAPTAARPLEQKQHKVISKILK